MKQADYYYYNADKTKRTQNLSFNHRSDIELKEVIPNESAHFPPWLFRNIKSDSDEQVRNIYI
jgi:hypothetical protein